MKDITGIEYDIDCIVNSKQKIIIWGAGRYGRYIYRYLKRYAVDIYAVIDKRQIVDAPVKIISLGQLDDIEQYLFVVAARWIHEKLQIKKQLLDYGVKPTQIVIPIPYIDTEFYDPLLMEHPDFMYPSIATRWNYVRREGSYIANYFEQNDIYRIGVYEIKEFEGWMERDLEWSGISVCQIITDEYLIDDSLDAIVVLDIVHFDYIEEQILKRTKCTVISILEILK